MLGKICEILQAREGAICCGSQIEGQDVLDRKDCKLMLYRDVRNEGPVMNVYVARSRDPPCIRPKRPNTMSPVQFAKARGNNTLGQAVAAIIP